MNPTRVRLSRARGWRLPPNTRSVAFPSRFTNPHRRIRPRAEAVRLYEADLLAGRLAFTLEDVRRELKGWHLACWCPLDDACHADVLLRIANEEVEA